MRMDDRSRVVLDILIPSPSHTLTLILIPMDNTGMDMQLEKAA
jgi:hypothetical protein